MIEITSFGHKYNVYLKLANYTCGQPAIQVMEKSSLFTMLTTCLPDVKLEEGEFLIKTYSENKWATQLLNVPGLFIDTGKYVKSGFVTTPIWKAGERFDEYLRLHEQHV